MESSPLSAVSHQLSRPHAAKTGREAHLDSGQNGRDQKCVKQKMRNLCSPTQRNARRLANRLTLPSIAANSRNRPSRRGKCNFTFSLLRRSKSTAKMDNPLLNRSKAPKKKPNKKSKAAVKSALPALSPGQIDPSGGKDAAAEGEIGLFELLQQQLEISDESAPAEIAPPTSNGISQLAGGDRKPSRQQIRKVRLFLSSLHRFGTDAAHD